MENMRHLLLSFNASLPLHLGFRYQYESPAMRQDRNQGFMAGGSGYILTKEAIRRFVEIALVKINSTDPDGNASGNVISENLCVPGHEGLEDVNLGKY